MYRTKALLTLVLLGSLMLACSLGPSPSPTLTEPATPTETKTSPAPLPTQETPAPTMPTEAVIETPVETPVDIGSCTLDARFVEDVSVPDDTPFVAGTAFRKTWRIRNAGTCNWAAGTRLALISGETLGAPESVLVPAAAAGAVVDVSIDCVAPAAPGAHRGSWQLQTPDGTAFGSTLFVKIVVSGPTPSPTLTATPSPETSVPPTCATPVDAAFQAAWQQGYVEGVKPGCPQGAAYATTGAFQEYWANVDNVSPRFHYRSLAIWTLPYKTGEIYWVIGQDTLAARATFSAAYDSWQEGDPEIAPACAEMTIPSGYSAPIRGFGKRWCENNGWEVIGWPHLPEAAVNLWIQYMENGRMFKITGQSPNAIPATYIVIWQYDTNAAKVSLVGP